MQVLTYSLACLPLLKETPKITPQLFRVLESENFCKNIRCGDEGTGWKNWRMGSPLNQSTLFLFQSYSTLVKRVSHSTIILRIFSVNCFDEFLS